MKTILSATFWISVYMVLVLAPLLLLILGEVPTGSGFWWDFSMALGFAGMAMMGVQFLLTARFRRATAPFGIDIIYYFHRYLALMAFALIFLHFLIIRIDNVEALGTINPLQAPWYMTAGRLSLMLFTLLIITSLWRKPLHIHYDEWRMLHIGLTVVAFLLALGHIEGVGYYINAPAKRWLWMCGCSNPGICSTDPTGWWRCGRNMATVGHWRWNQMVTKGCVFSQASSPG
jgi:predicted ferric reductase